MKKNIERKSQISWSWIIFSWRNSNVGLVMLSPGQSRQNFRWDFLFSFFRPFWWDFIFSLSLFSLSSFWWDFIFSHSFFSFDYSGEVSYLSLHFSRLFFILVMFLFFTYPLMKQFFLIKIWKTSPMEILHILGLRWFNILFCWPMQV